MSDQAKLADRKAKLSEARRRLLEKRLKGKGSAAVAEDRIPHRDSSEPVPLSFSQQRFWFMHQLDPNNPTYNMHEAWEVKGALNRAALERALNRVVARHDALRTTIGLQDDVPVQILHPDVELNIPLKDLSDLPEKTAALREIARQEARGIFDLEIGPLLRFSAVRLSEDHHALLLTIHHIISDEYANDLFWRDLGHFYAAECNQPLKATLPDLPIRYEDFTAWQIDRLNNGEEKRQLAYWKNQLAGDPAALQLPTDRPRPPQQTFNGGFAQRDLSSELIQPLQKLAQDSGATPFMLLLAAYQAVLNRYSQSNDIWVGTPIANRQRSEVKDLIGLFLNTIVMRAQFEPELTFRQLVEQVKQHALDAFAHQDLPFERLVDELKPQRDPAASPLFQVMFVYSPAANLSRSLPGLTFEWIPVDGGVSKFDLTLFASAGEKHLTAAYEYNADLFDRQTVTRLLGHLETFLTAALADPDQPLAQLPILAAAEQEQILTAWNRTQQPFDQDALLHEMIERQAQAHPHQTAVWAAGETISYRELDQRANQLAHFLRSKGVQSNSQVGVLAARRLETVMCILAILKAGAAYVPIDPEYPAERITAIIEDADLRLILAGDAQDVIGTAAVQTVDLAALDLTQYPANRPQPQPTADHLAYVIFTSGSTGRPKGVMVTHRNIVHSTTARFSFYERPAERFLLLSSFAFDSSMVGLFWTLCQGGTLFLPGDGLHQDILYLSQTINEQRVTHLLALPSLYHLLLEESETGQLASLNTVMVAGEACHASLVHYHYAQNKGAVLVNEYGPTEGTVWSHAYRFPADFDGPAVPIGRAIPNVTHFVLDPQQQAVPVGVPGELYIGGAGITPGYLNRPDLTTEKFVPLPSHLGVKTEEKFYRTGDLVRWLPDGNLVFLGRVDQQVKIRGFRIELGEIEAALAALPQIKAAAALVYDRQADSNHENAGRRAEKRLIGYYEAETILEAAEVKRALNQKLPHYMVPAVLIQLDKMPHTPNGKIDRRALPEPPATAPVADGPPAAPRTTAEQRLTDVWRDVLRLPNVGIHDNFFDLGGDSIIGIQIVARARRAGLYLTPRQLFEQQTIAELAAVAQESAAPAAEQGVISGSLPLTPIQAWFFEQAFTDQNHWHQSLWLEPVNPWQAGDTELLIRAAQILPRQHDALRLCFSPQADGSWTQTLPAEIPPVTLQTIDLQGLSTAEQEGKMAAWSDKLSAEIDMTRGDLVRGAIFNRGSSLPPRIFITVHHLAIDGVSWRPLLADWATAFEQLKQGEPINLPAKTSSFKAWSEWLVQHGEKPAVTAEADFWQAQLADQAALPLAEGKFPVSEGIQIENILPADITAALLAEANSAYNTTINDLLLTALAQAAAETLDLSRFSTLLEGHGREETIHDAADLSRTVGWFTTQYPVTLSLNPSAEIGAQIKSVKEQLRVIPDNGIGYGALRTSGRHPALSERSEPLFTFNYLGQLERSLLSTNFFALVRPLTPMIGSKNHRPHGLGCMAFVQQGRFHAIFDYHPQQIEGLIVQKLADRFIMSLQALIDHCVQVEQQEMTASDFDLVDLDEEAFDQLADLLGDLE